MRGLGVADYEDKELLERLWKSGLKTKAILAYLEENNLPTVSATALSKYGQRNWNDTWLENEEAQEKEFYGYDALYDIEDIISDVRSSELGEVERVSISKTGYSVSIKPKSPVSGLEDIESLARTPLEAPRRPFEAFRDTTVPTTIIVIPDTQIEPGRSSEHIKWFSNWANWEFLNNEGNIVVVHLGDHWNMGSLSSYDKGKGSMEGRRYLDDIKVGNEAFELFDLPDHWDKWFLKGNHEDRVNKAVNSDIQLEGLLTTDHMITEGWTRVEFLDVVDIAGVSFAHYFYNPNTSKPYGGIVDTRLKTIGHSFVMGHQQGMQWGSRYVRGVQQFGLVAGSFYLHDEDYKGPQGNDHWQGIVVLRDVQNGSCESPQFISMDYLCRYNTDKSLSEWKKTNS